MRIVYAPRALRDIDEILAHIQERRPRGARVKNLAKVPDDS
jgi:plasmid stabilization system protein ParE